MAHSRFGNFSSLISVFLLHGFLLLTEFASWVFEVCVKDGEMLLSKAHSSSLQHGAKTTNNVTCLSHSSICIYPDECLETKTLTMLLNQCMNLIVQSLPLS